MKASQKVSFTLIYIWIFYFIFSCLLVTPQYSFASSSFSRQDVVDPSDDWVNMANITNQQLNVESLFQPADIRGVNFFSNGKILNATIWIDGTFREMPPAEFGRVSYGAYIDADFNEKTGLRGVDYRVETMRENGSQSWSRVFEEWSTSGEPRQIDTIDNHTGFSKEGERFVTIYADLEAMGSPDRFRIVFFAETDNGLPLEQPESRWYADYTNWIFLPPPDFALSTIPEFVTLDQGGNENIAIQIKSTTGTEPTIYLSPEPSNTIEPLNLTSNVVHMPPFGMATTGLHIVAKPNAEPGSHLIFLRALATFPSESIIEGDANRADSTTNASKPPEVKSLEEALQKLGSQDVEQILSFPFEIKKPVTLLEQIPMIWDRWGNLVSFILGSSLVALLKERFWKVLKPRVMKIKKNK
jgi:hypothetical protein